MIDSAGSAGIAAVASVYAAHLAQISAGAGTEVPIHTEVLYHRDADGFASAFAGWCALGERGVRYRSVQYDEPVPELAFKAKVFVLDFSYSRRVLLDWVAQGHEVVVLDHHKTAAAELEGLACAHFDMTKAGCELAWDYFSREENITDQAPAAELLAAGLPWLLRAVADRDLWTFRHPETAAICARLELEPWEFPVWYEYADCAWASAKRTAFVAEGQILLRYQQNIVKRQAKHSGLLPLRGVVTPVPAANAPVLGSETAHELLSRHPMHDVVAVYAWEKDGVRVSLRGTGSADVAAIAQRYDGGGGHQHAAGFFVSREMLLEDGGQVVNVLQSKVKVLVARVPDVRQCTFTALPERQAAFAAIIIVWDDGKLVKVIKNRYGALSCGSDGWWPLLHSVLRNNGQKDEECEIEEVEVRS